ncbi:MAG: minor capsid protein [Dialister pneumosintes]
MNYWEKRAERLKLEQMSKAEKVNVELKDVYSYTLKRLKQDVNGWYERFAKENDISLAKARTILDKGELKEFKMTLKEYTDQAKRLDLSKEHIQMLSNASIRQRLTRAQELYVYTAHHVEKLAKEQELQLTNLLKNVYEDSTYKTAYQVQQMQERYSHFDKVSKEEIAQAISKPWARDGKDFSSRIWDNKNLLLHSLQTEITQSLILKEGTDSLSNRIVKRLNVSYNNARRLVETETAYIQERASFDVYDELEVEKYQILATLDNRTTDICRHLDGEIFDKKDAKIGVTVPPFHCYCRTTTIPYIGGVTDAEGTTRTARDSKTGKGVAVKGDLTYEQWEDTYVANPKFAKMCMNLVAPTDEFIYQLAIEQGKPYTKGKVGEERFYADNGRPIYPPNNGGIGTPEKITLKSGEIIYSRYGKPTGSYVSPKDTSFEERAMPRTANTNDLHYYRVVKDIKDVERSIIAAWFGQKGLGIQLKLPSSVESLEENLKEVFINEPN